mmetsp:Transcript_43606/g.59556  ORF Transcript_43606/g.59556 Transcript_43606/m.59556 type:complete len:208 (-) Transcript_43606:1158-1781(-)
MFTSNVDAHAYDYLGATEVHECHGSIELYQCATPCEPHALWRSPQGMQFVVDPASMLCTPGLVAEVRPHKRSQEGNLRSSSEKQSGPHHPPSPATVGATRGIARRRPLKFLPTPIIPDDAFSSDEYPSCPQCGRPARPAILMFNDADWVMDEGSADAYDDWKDTVVSMALAKSRGVTDTNQTKIGKAFRNTPAWLPVHMVCVRLMRN